MTLAIFTVNEKLSVMITGRATKEGTDRYRQRFSQKLAPEHYRNILDLWISSIGLGTYLGNPDESSDRAYEESIYTAFESGCNAIDTAINYRFQRSERS